MQRLILFLFLTICFVACQKETIELSEETKTTMTEEDANATTRMGLSPVTTLGNIFVAIVTEEYCGNSKYLYSIYASASNTVGYDREVQAAVIKNGSFIEAKVLTIPANQRVSGNAPVFSGANRSYGNVVSKAFNVLGNGAILSGYNFPSITHTVANCFLNTGSNCYIGFYPADNPATTANEGAGDQDEDGECNRFDPDDDGNGIPDAWE